MIFLYLDGPDRLRTVIGERPMNAAPDGLACSTPGSRSERIVRVGITLQDIIASRIAQYETQIAKGVLPDAEKKMLTEQLVRLPFLRFQAEEASRQASRFDDAHDALQRAGLPVSGRPDDAAVTSRVTLYLESWQNLCTNGGKLTQAEYDARSVSLNSEFSALLFQLQDHVTTSDKARRRMIQSAIDHFQVDLPHLSAAEAEMKGAAISSLVTDESSTFLRGLSENTRILAARSPGTPTDGTRSLREGHTRELAALGERMQRFGTNHEALFSIGWARSLREAAVSGALTVADPLPRVSDAPRLAVRGALTGLPDGAFKEFATDLFLGTEGLLHRDKLQRMHTVTDAFERFAKQGAVELKKISAIGRALKDPRSDAVQAFTRGDAAPLRALLADYELSSRAFLQNFDTLNKDLTASVADAARINRTLQIMKLTYDTTLFGLAGASLLSVGIAIRFLGAAGRMAGNVFGGVGGALLWPLMLTGDSPLEDIPRR